MSVSKIGGQFVEMDPVLETSGFRMRYHVLYVSATVDGKLKFWYEGCACPEDCLGWPNRHCDSLGVAFWCDYDGSVSMRWSLMTDSSHLTFSVLAVR